MAFRAFPLPRAH